jgi:hypothetical protein
MRRMLLVLALFSVVAAFVVAGCGSDGSTIGATGGGDTTSAASGGETTAESGETSGETDKSGETTAEAGEATEGSTEGTEAAGSLTKAEYVKQGNEACKEIQEKVGKEFEAFIKKQNLEEVAPTQAESAKIIGRFAIPAMEEQIDALRAIPAPSGDEEQVKLIIARQEESLKKMKKEPLFRTSGGPYEELNKPASDYGLTECSV